MNKHSAPLWDDVHLFNYSKFSRFRIRRCNRDFSEIWKEHGRFVNKGRKLFPIVKCFGILWSENTIIRSERNIGRRAGPFRAGRTALGGRVCGRCEPVRRGMFGTQRMRCMPWGGGKRTKAQSGRCRGGKTAVKTYSSGPGGRGGCRNGKTTEKRGTDAAAPVPSVSNDGYYSSSVSL